MKYGADADDEVDSWCQKYESLIVRANQVYNDLQAFTRTPIIGKWFSSHRHFDR